MVIILLLVVNFKSHIFTGPGAFTVCSVQAAGSNSVDYLVVAGGGGASGDGGAGGGGGGFRLFTTCMPAPQTSPLASSTAIPVYGNSLSNYSWWGSGAPSGNAQGHTDLLEVIQFFTISSAGGGGGPTSCSSSRWKTWWFRWWSKKRWRS